jgi:hypothetical protein
MLLFPAAAIMAGAGGYVMRRRRGARRTSN